MPSANGPWSARGSAISQWLEHLVAAFEAAWQRGERPAIDDYLTLTMAGRVRVLVELVHADLECRLKAGEAARVESYLERYPELAQDRALALDLITAEYTLRLRTEPALRLEDYRQRFPPYAPELALRFQAATNGQGPPAQPATAADPDATLTTSSSGVPFSPVAPPRPITVAGYEVLGELGRGGVGVVYKARQVKLNRLVALKMILAGRHAGTEALARFRSEAEAVARLQHPNIIQIYEVGEAEGRPFFALEFVAGGSLAHKLNGTPLPARQAAQLVQLLARAVHVAHQRGIVHRDLNPTNVLLARSDRPEALPLGGDATRTERYEPKVTDFGLAKLVDGAPGGLTPGGQTQSGALLGTPPYMAPEQATGRCKQVGPGTDVYALGAILYELLTGKPPFKAPTLMDTLQQVVHAEPVPPSRLQPGTARDLETICLKCLEKDPGHRYPSGQALADELARFQNDEPIQARAVGRVERLWRWCRRKPGLAMASGLALVAVLAAVLVAVSFGLYQAQTATELRTALNEAQAQERRAKHMAAKLGAEQKLTTDALDEVKKQRNSANHQRERTATLLAEKYLDHGLMACSQEGNPNLGMLWMCQALEVVPQQANALQQVICTNLAAWRRKVHALKVIVAHQSRITTVALSPDGQTVLTVGEDNMARLWEIVSGKVIGQPLHHQDRINAVAFSPDGKTILTGSADKTARLWEARSGKRLDPALEHTGRVVAVAFSPDGKTILTGSFDRTAQLWKAFSGKRLGVPLRHQGPVYAVAFSPDSKTVLTGSFDRTARLWKASTGQPLGAPLRHQDLVVAVALQPQWQDRPDGEP